jgi:site-specific DNA-cytosine methylase
MNDKIILDLCGGTGAWSKPYKDNGYDVRLITLPEYDVRMYEPPENIYGILAAPPCTEFALSGAVWWNKKPAYKLKEALEIVDACLNIIQKCNSMFWALENPVGRLKKLRYDILGEPTLTFNPCDYGDGWTKKTLVWGKFNIPIKNRINANGFLPHKILSKTVSQNQINKLIKIKYLPINYKEIYGDLKDRQAIRSITPQGFANAFFKANQ